MNQKSTNEIWGLSACLFTWKSAPSPAASMASMTPDSLMRARAARQW